MDLDREQLRKRLIESLKNKGNFGYKILNKQDLKLIKEWYNYPESIKLSEDGIKCFGSRQFCYTYHIHALTKPKEGIIVFSSSKIKNIIVASGRMVVNINDNQCILEVEQESILNSITAKIEQCKMIIWSNPDVQTGRSWSVKFLANLIELSSKNKVSLFMDQSLCDFQDPFSSAFDYQYENLIVLKQIGRILTNDQLILKAIALYKSPSMLKKADNQMKYIKMLAGDLLIELIRTGMGFQAKAYKTKVLEAIKVNYGLMSQLLKDMKARIISGKGSQILIMEIVKQDQKIKIEDFVNIMNLSRVQIESGNRKFLKMSLNQDTNTLQQKINSLKRLYPVSKL